MFGFLKDKLKKAVAAFSKSAESEVKEEKVDDTAVIEKAKEQEKKIAAKKPAAKAPDKKPQAKPKAEQKREAPKETEKKPEKEAAKPKPKEVPKVEQKKPEAEEHEPPREVHVAVQKPDHKPQAKQVLKKPEQVKETAEEVTAAEPKKQGFFSKLFGKKEPSFEAPPKVEDTPQAIAPAIEQMEEVQEEIEEIEEEIREDEAYEDHSVAVAQENVAEAAVEQEESSGFFSKLKDAFTKKTLTPEKFDELFWELELAMLENNVAVEVIEKIKTDLRNELTSGKVSRMGIEDMITSRLRQSIEELFEVETFDLLGRIRQGPKPFKICMIGVNGSGKTTTLAKIIHKLQKENLSVVVAASDTFRAAAIDQLKEHTDRLNVKLISQGYGADPAAVAFDAIKHAESKQMDVVLIDTAGRLHSNTNLMAELEKVIRVAKPDLKIFIGESITGNDCVEQAQVFSKLVGIDAIILSKADIDEKGGAAISVSYVTGKPILYLGTGQTYDDLEEFDKEKVIASLELE